jgi:hypothetical protein
VDAAFSCEGPLILPCGMVFQILFRPSDQHANYAGPINRFMIEGSDMKTVLKTLLFLILVNSALADDAAIKKQLIGKWKYENGAVIVLNADGSMDNDDFKTWDVKGGKYMEYKKTGSSESFTILKLSKTSLTIKEDHRGQGTGTWTRVQ